MDYEQILNLKQYQNDELDLSMPDANFISQLYEYQQQALTWMLMREGVLQQNVNNNEKYRKLHPLWQEFKLQDSNTLLYFNPFSGLLQDTFPGSSQRCKGGILADEMGLGKTIMFLALIHTNRRQQNMQYSSQKQEGKKKLVQFIQGNQLKQGNTLIIVPLTLLSQWENEINTHSKEKSIKLYLYYGTDRSGLDLSRYDIVITTYGVISHEYQQKQKNSIRQNGIFNYDWFRIILDEAHYIKGRTIQVAKAIYGLNGYYRWCSTGTPIQNKLDELFSLLHFIKLEPWSDYLWWNTYINKPFESGSKEVFDILRMIVKPIMLRRTKQSKNSQGNKIINLPNKQLIVHLIVMSVEEQKIYQNLEFKSKQEIGGLLERGVLMSQYMMVFELILRLRQVCDHPFLLYTRSDVRDIKNLGETLEKFLINRRMRSKAIDDEDQYMELIMNDQNEEMNVAINNKNQVPQMNFDLEQISNYKDQLIEKIKNNEMGDCPVCYERLEDAVISSCLHILCRLCMMGVLNAQHQCPICRQYLTKEDFITVPRESVFAFDYKEKYRPSKKIEKIMEILQTYIIGTKNKCIIFSQFLGMIDLIEFQFQRDCIKSLRLDGKLTQQQRQSVLRQFNEDASNQIFLISLKAGGLGLNLTQANHVIIVDPWWNPSVEDQATDRIYRIGQTKDVFVHKLIVQDTIEERIIELHQQKRQLFENTVCPDEQKKEIRVNLIKNLLKL